MMVDTTPGKDHGQPRWGMNTFDFLQLVITAHNNSLNAPTGCVSMSDSATKTKTPCQ